MDPPECVVCLQVFDEGEHTPRVLSCGHSVCQSCVADLRSHWGAGSGSKGAGPGLVRCPECKQHTKLPLGGFLDLPKNIELMRLLEAPIAQTLNPKPEQKAETLPFPLSEVAYGEPVIWILPQAAVKRRKDGDIMLCDKKLQSEDKVHGVCVGDMMLCDKKLQSEVSLQYLSKIDPGQKLKYKERVRLAWETLNPKCRTKLMRLLALRCNYFAEVAGFWMSEEGILFLVSKVYVEGVKQARSLFNHEGEGSPKEDRVTVRVRLGLELCEILMEVHAAGVVVGMLGVDSFTLDAFGHLRLHVGKCVVWTGDSECLSPEITKETGGDENGLVSQKTDVWSLGRLLLQLFSGSSLLGGLMYSEVRKRTQVEALEAKVGFKVQLLNCMAAVPSNRPRVVDVWRELKELLDEQPLEIPSHLLEDKLDMEMLKSGSTTPADNSWIEPETASEITSTVEATPSLSRAMIDVMDCDAEVKTLHGHLDTVSCLSVFGSYLISASFDKTLRLWSLNDYRMVHTFKGHEQRITALAVYEASELCISGDYGGYIYAWNVASRENPATPLASWQEHQDWRYSGVASLAISGDELLYSGSGDRTIKAWSTSDFKQVATMEGHKGVVSVLMVEGQFLLSGSWDGTIRLWWRPDHSPLASFGGGSSVPSGGIRALVKCPASGLLFSGHDSGVIQIWNEEDCVGTFKAHTGVISALTFDQDWLYSSSWDGFVKAWPLQDVLSGSPIPVERKCNQAAVTALCCSGQDRLFVGTTQKIQVYSREAVI